MSNAILGINFGQSYASIAVIDKVSNAFLFGRYGAGPKDPRHLGHLIL